MSDDALVGLLLPQETIEQGGIFVAKGIAERTVWDKLSLENPTHAVISAANPADAREKSKAQITDIASHLTSTDVLLDFGSGYGRVAEFLLPQMPLRGYIGMDSSYEMLNLFRQRYVRNDDEQQTPLLLLNADIHTVPLRDNSVDVAIVCAVFLHNHKDVVSKAMDELRRVLKPGGTLLVYSSFPRQATAMGIQGMLYQAFLNLLGKPFKNGPVRYYSLKEVTRLLRDFKEVRIRPCGFTVVPKSLIFLPRIVDTWYRVGIANPINSFLENIVPASLKAYFAVHYDVVARR